MQGDGMQSFLFKQKTFMLVATIIPSTTERSSATAKDDLIVASNQTGVSRCKPTVASPKDDAPSDAF